jgi:phage terminase large subunit-like protein
VSRNTEAPGRAGNTNARKRADSSPGPWAAWPETDRAERAIRFIEEFCRPPTGHTAGEKLVLAGWQKDWLRAVLAPDVRSAVLSLPRGQGKSTFAAAVAVWSLFDPPTTGGAPQIPIVATTVGQAVRSVYSAAVAMVEAEPELAKRAISYQAIGNTRLYVPGNRGEMMPISADVDGLQGLNPSLAICDEIGFVSAETWNSLLLASGKRPSSLVWGTGTPGLDRENALYALRKLVNEGATLPGFIYKEFAAPLGADIYDEAVWIACNPAIESGYLSIDALRTAAALSPKSHFMIFRLGMHDVEGTDSWLGEDGLSVWNSLKDAYEFTIGAPTWVGVDVGLKRDSTAVVSVQFRPDGRIHATAKIWLPATDEPVDARDVMDYLRRLCDRYQVGAIAFDPRFFDVPAKMLYDEGLPMVELPQSVERMTPAIGSLYELIRNGGLSHNGEEGFTTQVLNGVPRLNERGFTLQKNRSRGRIDAAIALALAVDRALHKKERHPVVVL